MRSARLVRDVILPDLLVSLPPADGQVIDFRDRAPEEDRPRPEALPTPQEIIDRHIEVTGGRADYERIHNRKVIGAFRQGDQIPAATVTIHHRAPNHRHVELAIPGGGSRFFVTNSDESWTYDGDLVVAAGGDHRVPALRRAAFHMLLHWREHFELAKTVGVEDVGGRPAYKVRLTAEDCHKVSLFFDKESGRHVRTVQEIAYAGETIQADASFSDYRRFGGIELPTRTRRVLLFGGTRTVQEYEYETVEHNVDMPDELFETPPELLPGPAEGVDGPP